MKVGRLLPLAISVAVAVLVVLVAIAARPSTTPRATSSLSSSAGCPGSDTSHSSPPLNTTYGFGYCMSLYLTPSVRVGDTLSFDVVLENVNSSVSVGTENVAITDSSGAVSVNEACAASGTQANYTGGNECFIPFGTGPSYQPDVLPPGTYLATVNSGPLGPTGAHLTIVATVAVSG